MSDRILTTVLITPRQKEFLRFKRIKLSKYIREKIDEMIEEYKLEKLKEKQNEHN